MKRSWRWLCLLAVLSVLIPLGLGCSTAPTLGCTGEGCPIPGPDGVYVEADLP